MIRQLVIVLCLLICCQVSGQIFDTESQRKDRIDTLLHKLSYNTLKPVRRINFNLKLVSLYTYSHPTVDSLIERSLNLAKEKELPFFVARSLKFRARSKLYQNRPDTEIMEDINEIQAISDTLNNKLLPGWISHLLFDIHLRKGEFDEAKIHIDSFERRLQDNKYAEKGTLNTLWGMYYQKTKQYSKAMEYYQKALNSGNPGITYIYTDLASLQIEMQNFHEATKYVEKAISHSKRINNGNTLIRAYKLMGQIKLSQKDTLSALENFRLSESYRALPFLSKNYSSAHLIIEHTKDEEEKSNLLKDISSYANTEEYPYLLVQKGWYYLERNKINLAFQSCKEGLSVANQLKIYEAGTKACDCLIKICNLKKDKDCIIKYLSNKSDVKDKETSQKRIKSLAKNLANYEANKDKALLEQAHQKDKEIISERLNKILVATVLSLILLSLAVFTMIQLRKRNRKIDQQNAIISKALSEKDILLREIHHRVKNNLQLVSSLLTLQSHSIDDKIALQAINEGKSRVRSMALIHQDLYNQENLTGISVKSYLEKLTQELFSTYKIGEEKVNLHLEIDDLDLDVNTMVPLGLIINELVTNCLKYAFPNNKSGYLKISLNERDEKLQLIVSDNGVGYNPIEQNESSFGSTLIDALTDQLGGVLTKNLSDGTSIAIQFDDYNSN